METLDDFAGDHQAEADSFGFSGDEGFGEAFGDAGGDSGSVVGDDDAGVVRVALGGDGDVSLGTGGFDGVEAEV